MMKFYLGVKTYTKTACIRVIYAHDLLQCRHVPSECFVVLTVHCILLLTNTCVCGSDIRMSKSSRVPASHSQTKEPGLAVKTAAVRAVADSTQRKSTRKRKQRAFDNDASDDSNQVLDSHARRTRKASKKGVGPNHWYVPFLKEPMAMGRQIRVTLTAHDKTRCAINAAESSTSLPPQTISSTEVDDDKEDSHILMREWLERKANKGNLPGLQWYNKDRRLVKISWKHGSKSGWTANDSQVFTSWARCTGQELITCDTVFICESRIVKKLLAFSPPTPLPLPAE